MRKTLAALALLIAVAAGCSPSGSRSAVPGEDWVVERESPTSVRIAWTGQGAAPKGRIFAGRSRVVAIDQQMLGALSDGEATISGLDPKQRPYFAIVAPGSGRGAVVAERLLPLEGAANFRDLGGYRASDGRRVRFGELYRSDDLSELSDADLEYLSNLSLRVVCDFRSLAEREAEPDRLPPGPAQDFVPMLDRAGMDAVALRAKIASGDLGDSDFRRDLTEAYRVIIRDHTHELTSVFSRIARAGGRPTLLHCTAGKDRTGVTSALILHALGVPDETIFGDFALSNDYTAEKTRRTLLFLRVRSLFRMDVEKLRPLLTVERGYLEAAFAEAVAQKGSVDAYIRESLSFPDEARARLRAELLE